jgi:hypothetical protein
LERQEVVRRLQEFVTQLEQVLQAVVDNPEGIIPGRHHDVLGDAWLEVKPQFDRLHKSLRIEIVPKLDEAGLAGSRLVFELGVFNHARDELLDHAPRLFAKSARSREQPAPYQKPGRAARFWRRAKRLFRRCLSAADVVLDSLAAVPAPEVAGPAAAIKEIKDGVKEAAAISEGVAFGL